MIKLKLGLVISLKFNLSVKLKFYDTIDVSSLRKSLVCKAFFSLGGTSHGMLPMVALSEQGQSWD